MDTPIEHVSDTAFWIADLRRVESERNDALFHDRLAATLAGERGRRITEGMPTSRIVGWTVAIRTIIIDEFLRAAIDAGVDTVLNLGAGLDARPYRLQLPPHLHWVEADYAEMIDYKESKLGGETASCRVERVKVDLADPRERRALLTRVNSQAQRVLVLTEGVVPYLSSEDVASLADDILLMGRAQSWILDYFSPEAHRFRRRTRMARSMRHAPFKFEPPDFFGFFEQHGWRAKEIRYLSDESDRVGRRFPIPLRYLLISIATLPFISAPKRAQMRRTTGYVILEPIRLQQSLQQ